jgi:hypothetical protein
MCTDPRSTIQSDTTEAKFITPINITLEEFNMPTESTEPKWFTIAKESPTGAIGEFITSEELITLTSLKEETGLIGEVDKSTTGLDGTRVKCTDGEFGTMDKSTTGTVGDITH